MTPARRVRSAQDFASESGLRLRDPRNHPLEAGIKREEQQQAKHYGNDHPAWNPETDDHQSDEQNHQKFAAAVHDGLEARLGVDAPVSLDSNENVIADQDAGITAKGATQVNHDVRRTI